MKEVVTLTITGVALNMTGDYKVVATNTAGTAEHVAKVTVCGGFSSSTYIFYSLNLDYWKVGPLHKVSPPWAMHFSGK